MFMIEGKKQPLLLDVKEDEFVCRYGNEENVDVYAKLNSDVMDSIVNGRITFQRAFMTGSMTAKGNFKTLRMLDSLFKLFYVVTAWKENRKRSALLWAGFYAEMAAVCFDDLLADQKTKTGAVWFCCC